MQLEGPDLPPCALAMVSMYSSPDDDLLEASYETLYACKHHGVTALCVIDVKSISAVVAMPPLPRTEEEVASGKYEGYFYLGEKPGMDAMHYADFDELAGDIGNENNEQDEEDEFVQG